MEISQQGLRYSPVIDLLAARAVDLIWNRYPGYSDDVFPKSDLVPSVKANVSLAVRVLRRGETPNAEELRRRAALGRQRARQSVPLESVIQAYRCTERVILLDLFSDSRRWPIELTWHYANLVISTFDHLTQEIVNSYRSTMSAMQTARQLVERDLVTGLASGYTPLPQDVRRWTRTLEIDEHAPHVAVAVHVHSAADTDRLVDHVDIHHVHRRVRSALEHVADGPVLIGDVNGMTYAVFSPRGSPDTVLDAAAPMCEGRADEARLSVGIGETASDLLAATTSCSEARDAARICVSRRVPTARFADVMTDVLLIRQPDLAEDITRTRLGALERHPHLIETVRSLVRNDLSQSAVSRELFVHLNTVAHRLRRVRELTGFDPLSLPDLQQLALALSWRDLRDSRDDEASGAVAQRPREADPRA